MDQRFHKDKRWYLKDFIMETEPTPKMPFLKKKKKEKNPKMMLNIES